MTTFSAQDNEDLTYRKVVTTVSFSHHLLISNGGVSAARPFVYMILFWEGMYIAV